jgi:hypothetical protein
MFALPVKGLNDHGASSERIEQTFLDRGFAHRRFAY